LATDLFDIGYEYDLVNRGLLTEDRSRDELSVQHTFTHGRLATGRMRSHGQPNVSPTLPNP